MSIVSRYRGPHARNYERKRRNQSKWAFENEVLAQILENLGETVHSVIDAPVGTGRFLHLYHGKVTGMDLSDDMLAEAHAKGIPVTLVKRDLLKASLGTTADLVVCFRFLNFLTPAVLPDVLGALLGAALQYAVFTIRTVEDDYAGRMTVGKSIFYRRSAIYRIVLEHGFVVQERYVFDDDVGGSYTILLCKRGAPCS